MGTLAKRYGTKAYYVHLKRDPEAVAESFMHRWRARHSIIQAFGYNILCVKEQTIDVARLYVSCVNANIIHFLRDKPNAMTIELEQMESQFPEFWSWIGAEGDLNAAIAALKEPHNATPSHPVLNRFRQGYRTTRRFIRRRL